MAAARFQTTKWSLVIAAGRRDQDASRDALASLCEAYWYPVYGFVRGRTRDEEEARDLTQSYFAALLDKNFLAGLNPEAGRFRSFLLVSIRNFLSNERDRERARKRGGGARPVSLDVVDAEGRLRTEPQAPGTLEQWFERRWAREVVRRGMTRLEQEFAEAGQSERFNLLRGFLVGDAPTLPYDRLARELDSSETAVKSMVRRLRRRLGVLLRAEVRQTVGHPDDVEDELRHLLRVLSEQGGSA